MSIKKVLCRIGLILAVTATVAIGQTNLVGRWELMKGSTRGNPEKMELLGDKTGIVDGAGITYKTDGGRFYITAVGIGKASSYDYKVSGPRLTLVNDDDDTLKYLKKGHTLSEREVKIFLHGTASVKSDIKISSIKSGDFTDSRNGQKYRTVKIGGKTWMGENLNFKIGNSWCYENNESNCKKYGRLYDWATAKAACPKGWHLPSRGEWDGLMVAVGGVKKSQKTDEGETIYYHEIVGKKLKSAGGWNHCDEDGDCVANGNGTDDYGFSALPSGGRFFDDGSFDDAGYYGYWWSATESGGGEAYYRDMHYYNDYVPDFAYDVRHGFSARCAED